MKLTIKDMKKVLNFLDVAKATTERAIIDSSVGSSYKDAMERQQTRSIAFNLNKGVVKMLELNYSIYVHHVLKAVEYCPAYARRYLRKVLASGILSNGWEATGKILYDHYCDVWDILASICYNDLTKYEFWELALKFDNLVAGKVY